MSWPSPRPTTSPSTSSGCDGEPPSRRSARPGQRTQHPSKSTRTTSSRDHTLSTTAGLCGLSFLQRRCEAMSSRSEAEDWAEELEAVAGRIAPRFGRAEPRRRALAYLQGLLAPLERKNGWHLAEAAGDPTPDGMQE